MQKKNYVQEILDIIRSGLPQAELAKSCPITMKMTWPMP